MAVSGTVRQAKARTRRPWEENSSFTRSTSERSSGVMSQRSISTSTAPLVTITSPPESWWTVLMSLRSESKGISVRRGNLFRVTSSSKPYCSPRRTRAVSVGSPTSPASLMVASEHSRAVRSRGSCRGSWKSASSAEMILPPV